MPDTPSPSMNYQLIRYSRSFSLPACPSLCHGTELYDRSVTRSATRISNPGCYATNTQMLLAPLLPLIDVKNPPSIFGISGYSGAGTKTGSNDEHGRPQTVPKIVSLERDRGRRRDAHRGDRSPWVRPVDRRGSSWRRTTLCVDGSHSRARVGLPTLQPDVVHLGTAQTLVRAQRSPLVLGNHLGSQRTAKARGTSG